MKVDVENYLVILVNKYGTLVRRFRCNTYPSIPQATEIAKVEGWIQPDDTVEVQRDDSNQPTYIFL